MKKIKKFFITGLSILSICATTVPLVALVSSCSATIEDYSVDPNAFILSSKREGMEYEKYIVNDNGKNYLMLPEANLYLINLDQAYDNIPEINYIVFPKSNFNLYGSIIIKGLESFRGFLWNGNDFSSEPPKSVPALDKKYKLVYEDNYVRWGMNGLKVTIENCTLISSDFKFPTIPTPFVLSIINSNFNDVDLRNQKKLFLKNCWGYLGNLLLPRNLHNDANKDEYLALGGGNDRDKILLKNGVYYSGAKNTDIVIPKEIVEFTWCFAGDGKNTKFREISFEEGSKFYIHKNDDPYNYNFQPFPIIRILEAFCGYENPLDPYSVKPSSVMHLNFSNCKYIPIEYIDEIKQRYNEFKGYIDKVTLPDGSVLYPNNPKLSIIK